MHCKLLRQLAGVAVLAVAGFLASPATAFYITGCEDIDTTRATPQYGDATLLDNGGNPGPFGPYGWDVKYKRCFDGTKVTKDVEIDFQFDAALNYNDAQKAAYRAAVEANVEGRWNNKFLVRDNNNNMLFPVVLDVTTTGPFHQTVQVHQNTGNPQADRADMTNWFDNSTASVMAHEVGHMLGLFDEYIGGAVDQFPNPTLSDDGLMGLGALDPNPKMYERYYQQYADFMNTLNHGFGDFALQQVPLPATLLLLLVGLCLLPLGMRRH